MSDSAIEWQVVCQLDELGDNAPKSFEIGPIPVVLVKQGGEIFALEDICSHADVALSEGEIVGCAIECWLHGSLFDLRTGEPSGLPATISVPVYSVRTDVHNSTVSIAVNPQTGAPIANKEL